MPLFAPGPAPLAWADDFNRPKLEALTRNTSYVSLVFKVAGKKCKRISSGGRASRNTPISIKIKKKTTPTAKGGDWNNNIRIEELCAISSGLASEKFHGLVESFRLKVQTVFCPDLTLLAGHKDGDCKHNSGLHKQRVLTTMLHYLYHEEDIHQAVKRPCPETPSGALHVSLLSKTNHRQCYTHVKIFEKMRSCSSEPIH